MSELVVGDIGATAIKVIEAQGKLLEEAIRTVLVHVPSDEVTIVTQDSPHHMILVARGVPMYEVSADMFATKVTVTGGWMSWPPPGQYEAVELGATLQRAISRRNSKAH